jgi:hypothetical protein
MLRARSSGAIPKQGPVPGGQHTARLRTDVHVARGRGRGSECAAQGLRGALTLSRRGRTAATRVRGRTSEGRLRRTSRGRRAEEREARTGARAAGSEFQQT